MDREVHQGTPGDGGRFREQDTRVYLPGNQGPPQPATIQFRSPPKMPTSRMALLPTRGVLAVTGEDASKLLQGVITNDIAQLETQPALHAGLLASGQDPVRLFRRQGRRGLVDRDHQILDRRTQVAARHVPSARQRHDHRRHRGLYHRRLLGANTPPFTTAHRRSASPTRATPISALATLPRWPANGAATPKAPKPPRRTTTVLTVSPSASQRRKPILS